MKKFILIFAILAAPLQMQAQDETFFDLAVKMWRSVDAVQLAYAGQIVDNAYIEVASVRPEETFTSVANSGLLFGKTLSETIKILENEGYENQYAIDDNTHRMGYKSPNGREGALFIDAINNIVSEYYILYNTVYLDFDTLKKDFEFLEESLNNLFGKPSIKGREVEKKYLKMSAIRNDKGLQYANVYNLYDGMIVLTPVPVFTISGNSEGVKMLIYFMHTKSMDRGLNN